MKPQTKFPFNLALGKVTGATLVLLILAGAQIPCRAQQLLGSINGTVLDASGGVVGDADVKSHNVGTNMEVDVHSKSNGTYVISNLPVGTYTLTFTKTGFDTETHTEVFVSSDRTTTVDASLKVGQVSTTVQVTDVALMNQTDATNGYVVDQLTIQDTPLGTGSFTQLAILTPGVHADFLEGSGSNSGLGNQAIYANGNRATSNSFTVNGVGANNLFNGNSTSSLGENRFVLNTGENFGVGGQIQTNSVYGAIGQSLPTPPPDAIQEITVNAAMFDATEGNNSGAHIGVVTKSGTNQVHGSAWEEWQNSDMNAAPFFYNASPALTTKIPFENRNQFGVTLGGPIVKDKLFYFGSYQGVRIADATDATKGANVPIGLTDDRTAGGIATAYYNSFGSTFNPANINPAALDILQAKLPNGQYVIPSAQLGATEAGILDYDAIVQGPNAQAKVDQAIGDVDYQINDKDRLSGKYYFQNDPTTDPFGYETPILGFPQTLAAGSQVFTLSNNTILSPTVTWEQHAGFTRMRAYSSTGSELNPENLGMSLLGNTYFPLIEIENALPGNPSLYMGPSPSFANGGMYQNQWEYESALSMVKGRHTLQFGGVLDHTQLNIVNNNTKSDYLTFSSFSNFLNGKIRNGDAFEGAASRYYRSDTAGVYVNDNFKIRSNLTITAGLRWDFDGPLSEKYGKLTALNPGVYSFNQTTDTITNDGVEFASNNPTSATPGASRSLMTANQWGLAPRIGIAWSPYSKMTVRAGYGMYYDRGEFFTFLSPPAGSGFNGPFGVTLAPPFVEVAASSTATGGLSEPFGSTPLPSPPGNAAAFLAYLPNESQTGSGHFPTGNLFGPFEFGGYDVNNKLPYTQNWTLDLQYQLSNNWLFEIAYVGNHGTHEVLPIPFNQPELATPSNPVNGQTSSYGGISPLSYCATDGYGPTLDNEPLCPPPFYAGNAEVRVPYIGYDMNSVLYEAEGISNYNALQVQAHKRFSKGLQFTASYTYSHALDEQSGGGLFFNGNNPLVPKSNYASADFDQTHVFLINYSYTLPKFTESKGWSYAANGWTIGGQTVAQSGEPYSVYDYSGSVASLYYGTYDDVGNPSVPLSGAIKTKQAELQGTLGVNAATPVLNASDFNPVFVAPGQDGVPPCDASGCDDYESVFGTTGRNIFRGPFQSRFDMSLAKAFPVIKDRFNIRFEADAFNIFNHPDFDTPNNDVDFLPNFYGPPTIPPVGHLGQIQHTIGSPRFLQLGLHLTF